MKRNSQTDDDNEKLERDGSSFSLSGLACCRQMCYIIENKQVVSAHVRQIQLQHG